MKTPFRALLVTLLLLTPIFAGAKSHLSSDPAVVQSRVLVMNGRFDAALEVLRPLDREGPGKVDILVPHRPRGDGSGRDPRRR